MKSLKSIIQGATSTEWGYKTQLESGSSMFISKDGASLINLHSQDVQTIVRAAKEYSELSEIDQINSDLLNPYESLGIGGAEGEVYKAPIRRGLAVALKIYYLDECNGLKYFEDLVKARRENDFDTLTPYLATEDYIVTSLAPDLSHLSKFIQKHPELEPEILAELSRIREKGVEDIMLETYDGIIIKDVFISNFDSDENTPMNRYRFFIFDMMYVPS